MIPFINKFLSYIVVMLVIVLVAGIAMFIGITMRMKKDREAALELPSEDAVSTDGEQ